MPPVSVLCRMVQDACKAIIFYVRETSYRNASVRSAFLNINFIEAPGRKPNGKLSYDDPETILTVGFSNVCFLG